MANWYNVHEVRPALNKWVLVSDGEDISVGLMYATTYTRWVFIDPETKKLVSETVVHWKTHTDEHMGVCYWMYLPELPPKSPEDPEKVREGQLIGF